MAIVILVIVVVVICALLVLFYFNFKRDNKKRFMKAIGGTEAAKFVEIKPFLKECMLEKNRDKTLFVLRIDKIEELKNEMTEAQFEYLMEKIILRCKQVFAKQVLLFKNNNNDIYMLSKKTVFKDDAKQICEMLILETTRPIIFADAIKKTVSVNVCNLQMLNIIDIDVVYQQINTVLTKLAENRANSYEFIDAEINTNSIQYYELYKQFEYAIEHKALMMYYYPVVNIYSNQIECFEGKAFFKIKDEYCSEDKLEKFVAQSEQIASQILKMTYKEVLRQEKKWTGDFVNNKFLMSISMVKAQLENTFLFDDLRQVARIYSLENTRQIFEVVYDQDMSKECERKLDLLYRMGYKIHIKDFKITEKSMGYLEKNYISGASVSVDNLKKTEQEPELKLLIDMIIKYCEKNNKMLVITGVDTKELYNLAVSFGVKYIQGSYVLNCDKPTAFKTLKYENKNMDIDN